MAWFFWSFFFDIFCHFDTRNLFAIAFAAAVHLANCFFLTFEDIFIPKISQIQKKLESGEIPVVFIIGHMRSGTTNLHQTLTQHPKTTHGIMLETLVISVVGKYLFLRPSKILFDLIVRYILKLDTKNHAVRADEPMEESMYLRRFGLGVSTIATSPSISLSKANILRAYDFQKKHLEFIRYCMARSIYYNGAEDKTYVGCMVDDIDHKLFFSTFGNCKLISCIRNPVNCFKSLANMLEKQWGQNIKQSNDFGLLLRNQFDAYSVPIFQKLLALAKSKDLRIYQLDFQKWISDDKNEELNKLGSWLQLEIGCISRAKKSERHRNTSECLKFVSKEMIEAKLGKVHDELKEFSKTFSAQFKRSWEKWTFGLQSYGSQCYARWAIHRSVVCRGQKTKWLVIQGQHKDTALKMFLQLAAFDENWLYSIEN